MLETLTNFAIALLIGALVGLEREKHKLDSHGNGARAGLRTFILVAMAGAIAAWLSSHLASPWIFPVFGLASLLPLLVPQLARARVDPNAAGLTTEVAAVVVYLLGGAAVSGERDLAVALGIATSAVLAYKQPLHGLVTRINSDDLYAGLKLLVATFIVLPVLPDRTLDPWDALNPYKIWLLVVLISGLSLMGYVATRALGQRGGILLTGLTGGLVSSTAVTLSFSRQAATSDRSAASVLASGLLLAWGVMFVRVLVLVAIIHRPLFVEMLVPLLIMGGATLAFAAIYLLRASDASRSATADVPLQNPFSLISAMKFAALFAGVLLVVRVVEQEVASDWGTYVVALLAGLTDVDAITLSMANQVRGGTSLPVAGVAIVLAIVANTLVKAGMAGAIGRGGFASRVTIATVAILAGAAVSVWMLR
jgi:uncharacterized membrane protein (DUF4010 family)